LIPKIIESENGNNDSNSSNDKDGSSFTLGLVNPFKEDEFGKPINQLQFMRLHVPNFDDTSKAYKMISSNWALSCRNYSLSVELEIG